MFSSRLMSLLASALLVLCPVRTDAQVLDWEFRRQQDQLDIMQQGLTSGDAQDDEQDQQNAAPESGIKPAPGASPASPASQASPSAPRPGVSPAPIGLTPERQKLFRVWSAYRSRNAAAFAAKLGADAALRKLMAEGDSIHAAE